MKLAGAALLAAAFGLFGLRLAAEQRKSEKLLAALMTSLEILRGEISARLTPLPDCAVSLAVSGPYESRQFYASLAAGLDSLGDLGFSSIWDACLAPLGISPGARGALSDLGRSLGKFNAEEQAAAIDRCLGRLKALYEEMLNNSRPAVQLKLGLSFGAGLLLAVMLY